MKGSIVPQHVITLDTKQTIKALKFFEKFQYPFVLAQTLTETAKGGKQAVGIQSRRSFKLHGEFVPNQIRIMSAKKTDVTKKGFAESAVFTGTKLNGWMGLHEMGGTKQAHATGGIDRGKRLAIPGKGLKKLSFKTSKGKVKTKYKPKNITKLPKTFFTLTRKGLPVIMRRKSKKQYPTEIMYVFVLPARIKPEWKFEKAVVKYVNFSFKTKFSRNMKRALR